MKEHETIINKIISKTNTFLKYFLHEARYRVESLRF